MKIINTHSHSTGKSKFHNDVLFFFIGNDSSSRLYGMPPLPEIRKETLFWTWCCAESKRARLQTSASCKISGWLRETKGSGVQVNKSGPSCIYIALARHAQAKSGPPTPSNGLCSSGYLRQTTQVLAHLLSLETQLLISLSSQLTAH